MAIKTALQRLEAIETAIEESEKAIQTNKGDKQLMRERLSTLYRERRLVYQEYLADQNASTGGFFNKAELKGRV